MDKFDLIVIGGGPAGYLAAERAAQAGLKTLIAEKSALGGVCLNEGCIPTKTLLNSAKVLSYAKHASAYGVRVAEGATLQQEEVLARKNKVVNTLVCGVRAGLRRAKVNIQMGEARLLGKGEDGFIVEVKGATYCAERLLIATGSTGVIPPIDGVAQGLESGFVVTNKGILELTELPKALVIIGGGVIGLEMASYFATAGTAVTVVEMLDNIGGATEKDMIAVLKTALENSGVRIMTGARVTAVEEGAVVYEKGGESFRAEADKVLLSIGRRAVTQGYGLETLGVETQRGAIVTDGKMRTNVPNVYAAGDVNGRVMLAHTAYREAEVAVHTMTGVEDEMNYDVIPSVIYTLPEVACVGETEESALAKGINVKCVTLPMTYSGRYVAENAVTDGKCKLIVDAERNVLLGAHLVGAYAGELIISVSSLIALKVDIESIKRLIFPHPTVSEIIRETVFAIK